jgi:hypothetical protein
VSCLSDPKHIIQEIALDMTSPSAFILGSLALGLGDYSVTDSLLLSVCRSGDCSNICSSSSASDNSSMRREVRSRRDRHGSRWKTKFTIPATADDGRRRLHGVFLVSWRENA